jgi:predicted RNA-binding protein YlqC (UPF0109 family)
MRGETISESVYRLMVDMRDVINVTESAQRTRGIYDIVLHESDKRNKDLHG